MSRISDIDRHVGARLRERRVSMGWTQTQLADVLGCTYQQVFKYERGVNRFSAGKLYVAACALGVPVSHFYEGISADQRQPSKRERATLEAARVFATLPVAAQEAVSNLMRSLAGEKAA